MHYFTYKDGILYAEEVQLSEIAEQVGTPVYIYSQSTLIRHFKIFKQAFANFNTLICYSVKANTNHSIIALFASLGSGVDIVSGGELYRALTVGVQPKRIVYSGIGKSETEIIAALKAGILLFNIESFQELQVLNELAVALKVKAPISIRINPDIDAKTHPKITTGLANNKFGLDIEAAYDQYLAALQYSNINIKGISCHIGSQINEVQPFIDSLKKIVSLIKKLDQIGIKLSILDLGGGFGIVYHDEKSPTPYDYAMGLKESMAYLSNMKLILEPGRLLVGNAGILLTRVLYTKRTSCKHFLVVDAAMNDLIRPSLYNSYHAIWPVKQKINTKKELIDVVGPICESGDFFACNRELPLLKRGDLIAIMSTGAYGFAMSSNYNSRPRVAEVLVNDCRWAIVRQRESFNDLCKGEILPSWIKI